MSKQTQYLNIKNSTGKTIINAVITHATEDYGTQALKVENLLSGTSTDPYTVYTGPGSRDYWWLWWTTDGENYIATYFRSSISDHENKNLPGTIELVGTTGSPDVSANFYTNGNKKDQCDILSPW